MEKFRQDFNREESNVFVMIPNENIMIGLSGGINSAAALIYLCEYVEMKPKNIFLYYSHFKEHSPDTQKFVNHLVEYAKTKFEKVIFEKSDNSILDYFEDQKMIPHPMLSPCTRVLKIERMVDFMNRHNITRDIVGYVRTEWKRINRQVKKGVANKDYLIRDLDDNDCFALVEKYIGWYPEIYKLNWGDVRIREALKTDDANRLDPKQLKIIYEYSAKGYNYRKKSKRVFKHNNCLPCKNMAQWELFVLKIFYPDYYKRAMELSDKINGYWGRVDNTGESADCVICVV